MGKHHHRFHDWEFFHGIIQGRTAGESAIVRKCSKCNLKQVAFIAARAWEKALGDYALDEHYQ